MHRRFINNAVLIGKGQLALMPLLHKHEKQRRQQSRGLGAHAAAVALDQRRLDLGGNFREAVRRHALIGVFDMRVGKALQHHITIGRQIDAVVA